MAVNDNWHVHPGRDCCQGAPSVRPAEGTWAPPWFASVRLGDREKLRLKLTSDVMKLARSKPLREALPAVSGGGKSAFLVALPDDTMADIVSLADSLGGRAHVIVPDTEDSIDLASMRILRIEPAVDCTPEGAGG